MMGGASGGALDHDASCRTRWKPGVRHTALAIGQHSLISAFDLGPTIRRIEDRKLASEELSRAIRPLKRRRATTVAKVLIATLTATSGPICLKARRMGMPPIVQCAGATPTVQARASIGQEPKVWRDKAECPAFCDSSTLPPGAAQADSPWIRCRRARACGSDAAGRRRRKGRCSMARVLVVHHDPDQADIEVDRLRRGVTKSSSAPARLPAAPARAAWRALLAGRMGGRAPL